MNDMNFVARVKKYFNYLEAEYGFTIKREANSLVRPLTDGAVEYTSDNTTILIDSETGYVTVWFYRTRDGKKYYITPVDIHEYLNTNDREKALLLSTNPTDKTLALSLFNEKFLLNQLGWKGSQGTVQDLDNELKRFSDWIRAHTKFCLQGDFHWWTKFYEYKVLRARADRLRRGEDELSYVQVKDIDDTWKLIKQSVFKEELEYIEKLKKEFPE